MFLVKLFMACSLKIRPLSLMVRVQGRILKISTSTLEKCSKIIFLLLTNIYKHVT